MHGAIAILLLMTLSGVSDQTISLPSSALDLTPLTCAGAGCNDLEP